MGNDDGAPKGGPSNGGEAPDAILARFMAFQRIAADRAASDNEKTMAIRGMSKLSARYPDLAEQALRQRTVRGGNFYYEPTKEELEHPDAGALDKLMYQAKRWATGKLDEALRNFDGTIEDLLRDADAIEGVTRGDASRDHASPGGHVSKPRSRGTKHMPDELTARLEDAFNDNSLLFVLEVDERSDGSEDIYIEMTINAELLKDAKKSPRALVNWLWDKYENAEYEDEGSDEGDLEDDDEDDDDDGDLEEDELEEDED